jgi:hypothetical protein
MRRFVLSVYMLALMLLPGPALAGAARNVGISIMAETEVAVGVPVSVTISNPWYTTGYLIVKTANETATASLVVTVLNVTSTGDILICTSTAITTETTTAIYLGHSATAAEGITDVCDFAMSRSVKFTFTTSGAGADFDVTADMEYVAPGV